MNRRAVIVLLIALGLFLVAITIRSGWLFLASGGLISLLMVSGAVSILSLRAITLERRGPPEIFEGDPFTVKLKVINSGWLGRYLLELTDLQFVSRKASARRLEARKHRAELAANTKLTGPAQSERVSRNLLLMAVPHGKAREISYEMVAPVRGVHARVDYTLSGGDPFGLMRLTRKKSVESRMVVFPRVSWVESFPIVPEGAFYSEESMELDRKGPGQDYIGVREYREGDSLRHIHWRSTAKRGSLVVKEFQKDARPTTAMLVHLASSKGGTPYRNSLEDGLRASASLVNYCYAMGSPPLLVIQGDGVWSVSESSTIWVALESLSRYQPTAGPLEDLEGGLGTACRALSLGGTLIVITNGDPRRLAEAVVSCEWGTGSSLVWVKRSSYEPGSRKGTRALEEADLVRVCSGRLNLYCVEADREVGSCLSEPLTTIGS